MTNPEDTVSNYGAQNRVPFYKDKVKKLEVEVETLQAKLEVAANAMKNADQRIEDGLPCAAESFRDELRIILQEFSKDNLSEKAKEIRRETWKSIYNNMKDKNQDNDVLIVYTINYKINAINAMAINKINEVLNIMRTTGEAEIVNITLENDTWSPKSK